MPSFSYEEIKDLLPDSALFLVENLGFDLAIAFIKAFGGVTIPYSVPLSDVKRLSDKLGKDNALKIRHCVKKYKESVANPSHSFYVPRCAFLLENSTNKPAFTDTPFIYFEGCERFLGENMKAILEIIGAVEFEKFINHFQNRQITISKNPKTKIYKELQGVLSEKALADLTFKCNLEYFYIPNLKLAKRYLKAREIVAEYESSDHRLTHREITENIALKFGYSVRQIADILKTVVL